MNNSSVFIKYIFIAVIGFAIGYVFASNQNIHISQGHAEMEDMVPGMEMMDMDMDMDMDMMMNMGPIEADPKDPVPQIAITNVSQDMMGAVTIKLDIENFTFTPELVDGEIIPNEGHGHVYVNGEQAGRVYGEWVYIPAYHFSPGENRIRVTLNANTHGQWLVSSTPIQDTLFFDYE